jgi:beta-phosphoglucomutase
MKIRINSPATMPLLRRSLYSAAVSSKRPPFAGGVRGAEQAQKTHRYSIQAVLFDMDGVVIDSEPVHERTLRVASERLGHKMTQTELSQLKGMNQEASADRLKSLASTINVDSAEIIQIRAQVFNELMDEVRLMPHVLKFIEHLRDSEILVALTTSSGGPGLMKIFDRFNLYRYFDVVVTGDHVTHSKPHPEPYLVTTELLGIRPDNCLVVEDSVNGIISATAAGCSAIGLTTSFPKQKLIGAGAIFSIDTFEELERMMFSPSPIFSAS